LSDAERAGAPDLWRLRWRPSPTEALQVPLHPPCPMHSAPAQPPPQQQQQRHVRGSRVGVARTGSFAFSTSAMLMMKATQGRRALSSACRQLRTRSAALWSARCVREHREVQWRPPTLPRARHTRALLHKVPCNVPVPLPTAVVKRGQPVLRGGRGGGTRAAVVSHTRTHVRRHLARLLRRSTDVAESTVYSVVRLSRNRGVVFL
jgi:hypothetical protein